MNVVLDTNVLISALLWPGPSNKILQLVEAGKLTLCNFTIARQIRS